MKDWRDEKLKWWHYVLGAAIALYIGYYDTLMKLIGL